MRHQPLVASYAPDFPWLFHFLTSFRLHATGFLPPVIVVPGADVPVALETVRKAGSDARVTAYDVPARLKNYWWASFMRAQTAMMSGDIHCPDADVVWLWGSDCFITGPLRPEMHIKGGRPVMGYSTYDHILATGGKAPWRGSTKEALGWLPEHEFMRRLPLLYPTSLFARVRSHVGRSPKYEAFEDRVYGIAATRIGFSESNVLGAFAWRVMPDIYEWACVDGDGYPPFAAAHPSHTVQFWSRGGLDLPCDRHHTYHGRTPRQVMESFYGGKEAE